MYNAKQMSTSNSPRFFRVSGPLDALQFQIDYVRYDQGFEAPPSPQAVGVSPCGVWSWLVCHHHDHHNDDEDEDDDGDGDADDDNNEDDDDDDDDEEDDDDDDDDAD